MHTKKLLLHIGLILLSLQGISQNGYRLEFEDVITLSVDELFLPTPPATRTKSFTVPQGTVLKITGGRISMSGNYSSPAQYRWISGYLKIDDNFINGADSIVTAAIIPYSGGQWRSTYRITPDNPIWAPSGSTVTVGVEIYTATTPSVFFLASNWITGVIFRKVPN